MDDMPFKKLLVQLPSLTSQQLTTLTDRLRLLQAGGVGGSGGQAAVSVPSVDSWLLSGIRTALEKRGLGKTLPKGSYVRKLKAYQQGFEEKAVRVMSVLEDAIPDLSVLEKQLLGGMAADLLAANIATWGVVSADTMLRHVDRIPECIERAFPGYIQSGFLKVVLRNRRENLRA